MRLDGVWKKLESNCIDSLTVVCEAAWKDFQREANALYEVFRLEVTLGDYQARVDEWYTRCIADELREVLIKCISENGGEVQKIRTKSIDVAGQKAKLAVDKILEVNEVGSRAAPTFSTCTGANSDHSGPSTKSFGDTSH
jgi:hypothetical protein